MNTENTTIQGLINAMLLLIPVGAAVRVAACAVSMMGDDEKHAENKRRLKNTLWFTVFAEASVGIVNMIFSYYQ